jgi:hypothetical protein
MTYMNAALWDDSRACSSLLDVYSQALARVGDKARLRAREQRPSIDIQTSSPWQMHTTHSLNMQSTNSDRSSRVATASTPEPSSSSTPLLNVDASAVTQTLSQNTMSAPTRLAIPRAQTTAGEVSTWAEAHPLVSTAKTSTSLPILESATTAKHEPRPSLFKRITMQIDSALDLSGTAASNIPPPPSHWTDYAHRAALLQTWDDIHEAAASTKSKYPRSITGQLVAVEKSLLLQFPELGEGEVTLTRDWMEYVLGMGLRHPFCSQGKAMGKWEILSGVGKVGGARAWGPW